MSLLASNCQGLGRPLAARALREIVKEVDLVGIFLMETKVGDDVVRRILKHIRFPFSFLFRLLVFGETFYSVGRPELNFSILWQSKNILHLQINLGGDFSNFFCSLTCGPPLW